MKRAAIIITARTKKIPDFKDKAFERRHCRYWVAMDATPRPSVGQRPAETEWKVT
jgi:hypothetical protein